ncbi:hypothetical protein AAEY27_14615 [Kosakonia sp. BYX6]|uniref:DUF420 domain-containing protein n=1 Tax=Kosakonia calanthes TaxID=3139408 RepID=A0ABZ3B6S0_9ENTR
MILDTVMWLVSSVVFFAWIFGVTLKNTFATNAKHFGILIAVHLVLSFAAIALKKQGVVVVHKDTSLWVIKSVGMALKGYMAVLMIMMTSFFIALVSKGAQKMTHFHETYNAANLHRNPLKFYLRRESAIIWGYRLFFMIGGVYVLWAIWFKMPF